MEEYRANGARLGWLIDPARREVTVYRADGCPEQRAEPDVVTGETVLPGFRSIFPRSGSRHSETRRLRRPI